MSNTDTLRQGYEAFGRGDLDAATEDWHDDVRWEGSEADLPGSGTHEGRDAVKQSLVEFVQAFDQVTVAPDEFLESGDTVVVLGHTEGTGKGGGGSFKVPFVHVWRMRDGKAERVQLLTDTAVVADALRQ
jgi:ketosteroid isomerase-like protein